MREWASALASDAGRLAASRVANEMNIRFKTDGSTVTDIDREVEEFIRERITRQFPDHAVLGEEYGVTGDVSLDTPLWAVDPVDGTANLAAGLGQWGVSIGLIAGGVPVVGALDFPLIGESYAASLGGGATRSGAPLLPLGPGTALHGEELYGICSASVRHTDLRRLSGGKFRIYGSAALHLCYVADGRMKGTQSLGTSLYDVAAGLCVAREVGAVAGWASGAEWSALSMLRKEHDWRDALICAAPETLRTIRASYK